MTVMDRAGEFREKVRMATAVLGEAVDMDKCLPCGCFHEAVRSLAGVGQGQDGNGSLERLLEKGKARLLPRRYDCLGCAVCPPAQALNQLSEAGVPELSGGCPAETPEKKRGWPPYPGEFRVLRYRAQVAVCTLADLGLMERLAVFRDPSLSIVGTLLTENLGIERVVANVAANPHIRYLILCGAESLGAVGHRAGQSLLALAEKGLDERGRIVGALGKRPFLRNLDRAIVDHFRETVALVDRRETSDASEILGLARDLAGKDPGPAAPCPDLPFPEVIRGRVPKRMVPDPAGYFVIFADRGTGRLVAEHYFPDGTLGGIVEGKSPSEITSAVLDRKMISRLDHAAYLGQELARAERALQEGTPYVQDRAPEDECEGQVDSPERSCGGASSCREDR